MVCIKNMIKFIKIIVRGGGGRGGGGWAHIPIVVAEFYNQLSHIISHYIVMKHHQHHLK